MTRGELTAARMCSSAHRRRHRRSLVAATLIVAFSGAVFLTTVAGARRSDTAFQRMQVETRAAQLRVFGPAIDDATFDELRALPGVAEVGRAHQLVANVNGGFQSFGAVADDRVGRTVEVPRLLDGRRPHPDRTDEVAVPETLADTMRVGVGDHLVVSGYSPAQVAELMNSGGQPPKPDGAEVRLHVVGITRAPSDLSIEGDAGGLLLATPAFLERYGAEIGTFAPVVLFVRLSDPAAAPRVVEFLRRHAGSDSVATGEFQVQPSSEFEGGVQQSIDVLTTGLLVFAVVAGLAGLVVAAIVLRRVADGFARDVPLLQSLGVSRRMRVVSVSLAAVPVALVGAVLAVVGAFALSPLMPLGTARRAEPDLGFDLDGVVLVGGFVAVVLVTVGLGVWAAHRVVALTAAAPTSRRRPSALARRAMAAGLPSPATVGIAMTLEPGGPQRSAPTRTGGVAAVVAVLGVVAAVVFATSLDALPGTPRAYGTNWDAEAGIGDQALRRDAGPCTRLPTAIADDPAVAGVSEVCSGTGEVNGRGITVFGFARVSGDVGPTVLDGRAPRARDEVALGSDTLDEIHRSTGDTVRIASPEGTHTYTVVGRIILPVLSGTSDNQAIAEGAAVTGPAFARISSDDASTPAVLIRWRAGADLQAARRRLASLPEGVRLFPSRRVPLEVDRLEQVDALPWVLAALLAIIGCLGLAYALGDHGARRRTRACDAQDARVPPRSGRVHGRGAGHIARRARCPGRCAAGRARRPARLAACRRPGGHGGGDDGLGPRRGRHRHRHGGRRQPGGGDTRASCGAAAAGGRAPERVARDRSGVAAITD